MQTHTLNTIKTVTAGTMAIALFMAGTSLASAATYSYVNTSGEVKTVEANSASAALQLAVNIDPNSGVIEGRLGMNTNTNTNTNTSSQEMNKPDSNTPAADLRVALNALLREHVNLGMIALYNVIDDDDATTASVEALDDNTVELAAAIGSVYGDDAEDEFRQIWRDHIGFFANYATGLRTNDEDLREEAEENLRDYQQEIATFFNSALPNIDRETVIAGSGEHKDLLIEAMDEYHDGDYMSAYMTQREADKQISGIANLLAQEIVKQNPNSF